MATKHQQNLHQPVNYEFYMAGHSNYVNNIKTFGVGGQRGGIS